MSEFDVHDSVHLGKIYAQLKFQQDLLFMYSLFSFILSSTSFGRYLHPSSGPMALRYNCASEDGFKYHPKYVELRIKDT
jgi:hypothetical protein